MEPLIDRARAEYADLGVLPVDTMIALAEVGIDPDALCGRFSRELEEAE